MRRFVICVIVISVLTTLLTGCMGSGVHETGNTDGKINVISTIFTPYDFVREIAGDRANITMLLPPASESHSFEPTPQDLMMIQECDVFIYVGGESDKWVAGILDSLDTGGMVIVTLIDCVDAVEEEIVEGMTGNEDDEKAYDEHIWTSPANAKLMIRKITDVLCDKDNANADAYRLNEAAYLTRLDELDLALSEVVRGAVRKTLVFGDRFPFRYLTDAYGLEYFAAFPGCSSESEPSAATMMFLIDKVKAESIPVVFYLELSNMKIAETISEATGAKPLLLHACHNITKSDFEEGLGYMDLMTRNVEALREALY